jgi:hypothetical protein
MPLASSTRCASHLILVMTACATFWRKPVAASIQAQIAASVHYLQIECRLLPPASRVCRLHGQGFAGWAHCRRVITSQSPALLCTGQADRGAVCARYHQCHQAEQQLHHQVLLHQLHDRPALCGRQDQHRRSYWRASLVGHLLSTLLYPKRYMRCLQKFAAALPSQFLQLQSCLQPVSVFWHQCLADLKAISCQLSRLWLSMPRQKILDPGMQGRGGHSAARHQM